MVVDIVNKIESGRILILVKRLSHGILNKERKINGVKVID